MPSRFTGGRVAPNSDIENGTGDFGVDHEGLGHYDVIFKPAFNSLAAVVVTQVSGFPDGSPLDNAVILEATELQCRVKTGDANGNASDRGFSFIAIGD